MSYFNSDQEDYMRSLARIDPKEKCWCGWYRLGECPNGCPVDKTCADKLAARCPDCHNDAGPAGDRPIWHRVGCSARE